MLFAVSRPVLPAETEVYRQPWAQLEIVLHVRGVLASAKIEPSPILVVLEIGVTQKHVRDIGPGLWGALRIGRSGIRIVQRSGRRIEVHQALSPGLVRQNVQLVTAIMRPKLYFVTADNLCGVVIDRQVVEGVALPGVF